MTREQAIAILNNNWPGFPVSAESMLDMFVALGMITLEEPVEGSPQASEEPTNG